MKIILAAEHATDEASARAATGRTLGEWFAYLDARGGPSPGRRAIGDHLVGELKLDPWWASTVLIGYEAAHGLVEKDGRPKGYMVCATKSVKATPERCAQAFADAVGGKIDIICDGGVQRGSHVLKALAAGATALRIESVDYLRAVRAATPAPIVGIVKRDLPDSDVRITPWLSDAEALAAFRAFNYEHVYLRPASQQQAHAVVKAAGGTDVRLVCVVAAPEAD